MRVHAYANTRINEYAMFKRSLKSKSKKRFRTVIACAVCVQYVRDFIDTFEHENAEDENTKAMLLEMSLLVKAFDRVVLLQMQKLDNDSALWQLCNDMEKAIGKAPNVAEALKAAYLIAKTEKAPELEKMFKSFKPSATDLLTRLSIGRNAGKMMKFLVSNIRTNEQA